MKFLDFFLCQWSCDLAKQLYARTFTHWSTKTHMANPTSSGNGLQQ